MIRLGENGPKLRFVPSYNDMSHFFPGYWEVSRYFFVTDEMYSKLMRFTDPALKNPPPQFEKGSIEELLNTPMAHWIKETLELSGGRQVWEFNTFDTDLVGYVRQYAILGERHFQIWSWADTHLKLPILQLIANVLNRLRYFKNKKATTKWNKFLEKQDECQRNRNQN